MQPCDTALVTATDAPLRGFRATARWTATVFLCLLACTPLAAQEPAHRTYVLLPNECSVRIHVGKSGLFSFAGHNHVVEAPVAEGAIEADPENLAASSATVSFRTADLRVTGEGEPAKDVPKVQEKMVGPDVLDAARHERIAFTSQAVTGSLVSPGVYDLELTGTLALHGVERELKMPARVQVEGDRLVATGRTSFRQKLFGIKPVSVAGVVNVKDELRIEYRFVGMLPVR